MKYQGFQYDFTLNELKYLFWGKKTCLDCGGGLKKVKRYETLTGAELNSTSDPIFAQNARIKHYIFYYICQSCGAEFSLEELAKKKERMRIL